MSITQWPEQDRPRERLIRLGAESLSDAELLAIFLRVGVKGMSAVELARTALTRFGGLQQMSRASLNEFCDIPGLGPAKYAQFKANLELCRRSLSEQLREPQTSLHSPDLLGQFVQAQIGLSAIEQFLVIALSPRLTVMAHQILFKGTVNQTAVYPREVVQFALDHKASRIMIAHNHPSGQCQPSAADDRVTDKLFRSLELLEIELVDHLIVGQGAQYSYRSCGRAPFS